MKKISLTDKQKHFLKKIGIMFGAIGATALGIYVISGTELGYKAKNAISKKMLASIINRNDRAIVLRVIGLRAYYSDSEVKDILNAAAKVVDEISAARGLPPLQDV